MLTRATILALCLGCSSSATPVASADPPRVDAAASPTNDPSQRASADPPICPSLPIRTSAEFLFEPGLAGPGVFEVEVAADGETERCTITLGKPRPAVSAGGAVMMGPQAQETTCKLVALSGTFSNGALAGLERDGETKRLSVTIREQGKAIGSGTFEPDFTPDACGQRSRHQKLALTR